MKKPMKKLALRTEKLSTIAGAAWHRTTGRCHETVASWCYSWCDSCYGTCTPGESCGATNCCA